MSEELVVAGATAAMNAIAGVVGQMSWPEISGRIRAVLTRRGRTAPAELDELLDDERPDAPDARVLEPLLRGLSAEDLAAVRQDLVRAQTQVNNYGDKNAVNTGPGTQNVTFS
ncbi:hypothetical protein JGS22_010740 [Streptomyces sp. P38-E01]|uniref:Uncharacterized protein n=1 Tax=Streptomyces tardus TaxID=2780544 RepID=A0A949JDS9_9ACTN|nr:hypothetical protein [Streptomyces tardus]MBU7598076.1 hypothetical protein [Streptomyces tardus]